MTNEKIYAMPFDKVYSLLVNKAVRKGRTAEEVARIASWLTGYTAEQIRQASESGVSYGDFFREAPAPNPNRYLIKGSICGVKVEEIQEPLMHQIRCLDKLVDELAKGRPMEKILRCAPDKT